MHEITQENVLRDALADTKFHFASEDKSRGVIVGVVSLLVAQGEEYKQAIDTMSKYLPGDFIPANLPPAWKDDILASLNMHVVTHEGNEYLCVNEESNFWDKYYLVGFASCLGWDSAICVNASHAQDAVDAAADYAEKHGWMGYFVDYDDVDHEYEEEYCVVGNHGLYVHCTELHVVEIEPEED
jgi:hypothetical protein